MKYSTFFIIYFGLWLNAVANDEPRHSHYLTNRAPLAAKPYTELPLGSIKAEGWLEDQLRRLAAGMTGHLDEWYPEVVGERNGWLGGDGDGWERGPYWVDGLLPLAHILDDDKLLTKANRWVEWTLNNQREDGYLGPIPFETPPASEPGLQRDKREDWWPKMVMLKILQSHHNATADERVPEALTKYFKYQLKELPDRRLDHWTFWGNRRGGDNLMVVYWLYNITGDSFLLELGDVIREQTHPYTQIFLERDDLEMQGPFHEAQWTAKDATAYPFHCVNLAQGMKQPIIAYQKDHDPKHVQAVRKAFADLETHHGQPYGLFGGDEALHGRALTRGTELCTAVEMMFSLEKMLEITGEMEFADRLEQIAFNVLTSQISDDCKTRQYFQMANQVMVTHARRNFYNNEEDRLVFGLLSGYPCCTCNMHQAWPKFTQHLWMASADDGLAALAYAPSSVTAKVGGQGDEVHVQEVTSYPFEDEIRFKFSMQKSVKFPFHLRIPGWCDGAVIRINGNVYDGSATGHTAIINRKWKDGDEVVIKLPMKLTASRWHENSVAFQRGPLLYALGLGERWEDRGEYQEVFPTSPWNYALLEDQVNEISGHFKIEDRGEVPANPWTLDNAPIKIHTSGVRIPDWGLYNEMAGPIPWSPQARPKGQGLEPLTVVPFGCTTLRISAFPTVE